MTLWYDEIRIGDRLLLEKGSLTLEKGSIALIQGENGSGKTLLVKNIFYNLTNRDYNAVFVEQYNDGVAVNINVLQNITMSRDNTYNTKIKNELCQYGLAELLSRNTSTLSGGEKRMISILRAIFSNAEILILDEPTNDLDYKYVKLLIGIISKTSEEKNIVIVSHDDRLIRISKNIYIVSNHTLKLKSHTVEEKLVAKKFALNRHIKTSERVLDLKILRKILPYNVVALLLCIVFLIIVFIEMMDYRNIYIQENMSIPDNQVNVFIPISLTMSDSAMSRAFPALAVQDMYNINPIKQLETLKKIGSIMQNEGSQLTALDHLRSNEMITVYPLEFYNPYTNDYIFSVDQYLRRVHGAVQDTATLDTNRFFEQPYVFTHDEQQSFTFDPTKFNQVVEDLSSNESLHIVASAVVMNSGYTVSDFFESDTFMSLMDSNVYVNSNEVVQYVQTIMDLKELVDKTRLIIIAGMCILVMDMLALVLFGNAYSKNIRIAKNYGYAFEEIEQCAVKKCNNRIPILIVLAVFILLNCLAFSGGDFSQSVYIFSFYSMIYFSVLYWTNNRILKKVIEKTFRWNAR